MAKMNSVVFRPELELSRVMNVYFLINKLDGHRDVALFKYMHQCTCRYFLAFPAEGIYMEQHPVATTSL